MVLQGLPAGLEHRAGCPGVRRTHVSTAYDYLCVLSHWPNRAVNAANDLDAFIARIPVECVEIDRDQYKRAVVFLHRRG